MSGIKMSRLKNKYAITALLIVLAAAAIYGTGYALMEGQNPLQLGVTLWYLQSSDRDGLKIAADADRHLIRLEVEEMGKYLSTIHARYRGEWQLSESEGHLLTFEDQGGSEPRYLKVEAEPFLDKYYIVHILSQ